MQVKDYKFSNSDTRIYVVTSRRGYYMESHDCIKVFTKDISKARLLTESQAMAMSKTVNGGDYRFIEDIDHD